MVCVQGASEWLTAEEPSGQQTQVSQGCEPEFFTPKQIYCPSFWQSGTSLYA